MGQGGDPLTPERLHAAADLLGTFGDDDSRIGEYGLPIEALQAFVDESDWQDAGPEGSGRQMDPLALAIGISIGVIACRAK